MLNVPSMPFSPSSVSSRFVAVDQAVGDQAAFFRRQQGRLQCLEHARVCRRQEEDQRHDHVGGVQGVRAVMLHEGLTVAVPALRHDLLVHLVTHPEPAAAVAGEGAFVGQTDAAIQGDPAHQLRIDEMLAAAAHFPRLLRRGGASCRRPSRCTGAGSARSHRKSARRTCCRGRPHPSVRHRCRAGADGGRRCRPAPASSRDSRPDGRAPPRSGRGGPSIPYMICSGPLPLPMSVRQ